MNCTNLAERIESLRPDSQPRDVARLCLLLSNAIENVDDLKDESILTQAWK